VGEERRCGALEHTLFRVWETLGALLAAVLLPRPD